MQIEKFKTKFVIKGKYNEDVLALILKYEKKYWNKEKIEWLLPIDALQTIFKICLLFNQRSKIINHTPSCLKSQIKLNSNLHSLLISLMN